MPSAAGPTVQLFGRKDSRPTQKAIRFFKERRIAVSFVDLAARPPAPTELRRFADRLGPRALVDEQSPAWRDAGLAFLRMDDHELFERLLGDPRLLKLPLARFANQFTVGDAEATWKGWRPASQ
jgi:arsenate reductase-like glutaredoxin family protein